MVFCSSFYKVMKIILECSFVVIVVVVVVLMVTEAK